MKTMMLLACLAVLPAARALADDDCFVPMADWQPRESVARLAQDNGWTVRRIKIDDGCYEIKGSDANGRRIEVTVDPGTLRVIEVEYKDDDKDKKDKDKDKDHDDDDDDDGRARRDPNGMVGGPTPAMPVLPPPNSLFGNGAPPQVQVK